MVPSPNVHENEYGEPLPPLADAVNVKTVVASPRMYHRRTATPIAEIVNDVKEEAVPPFPSVKMTVA